MYRRTANGLEVLLGHMGGPFWASRDAGAWSLPKGEYGPDEPALAAARREFQEELGLPPPEGDLLELGSVTQSNGKVVTVWAVQGDLDPATAVPGTFEMEWPPGSGRTGTFPELNRMTWYEVQRAHELVVPAQREFLDRLVTIVGGPAAP